MHGGAQGAHLEDLALLRFADAFILDAHNLLLGKGLAVFLWEQVSVRSLLRSVVTNVLVPVLLSRFPKGGSVISDYAKDDTHESLSAALSVRVSGKGDEPRTVNKSIHESV